MQKKDLSNDLTLISSLPWFLGCLLGQRLEYKKELSEKILARELRIKKYLDIEKPYYAKLRSLRSERATRAFIKNLETE